MQIVVVAEMVAVGNAVIVIVIDCDKFCKQPTKLPEETLIKVITFVEVTFGIITAAWPLVFKVCVWFEPLSIV